MAAMQAAGRIGPVSQAGMVGNMPNAMTGPNSMVAAPMAGTGSMNLGMSKNILIQKQKI